MSIPVVVNGVTFDFPEPGDANWGQEVTDWAAAVSASTLQKTGGSFTLEAEVDLGAAFGIKGPYWKSRSTPIASGGAVRLARADTVRWRNQGDSADLELGVDASNALTFAGSPLTFTVSDTARVDLTYSSGMLSADLVAGGITNTYINASAAIARSKFAVGTANRLVYNADTTGAMSDLAAITAGRPLQSDSNGLPVAGAALTQHRVVVGDANGLPAPAAAITAARALISDANGEPTHSVTTATELGYVNGVTSAIQTQIDAAGKLKFLAAYSPSGAASVDITSVISATYEWYFVVLSLAPATDAVNLFVRTDTSNGASFDTGASDYAWAYFQTDPVNGFTGTSDNADSEITVGGPGFGNATGEGIRGVMEVYTGSAALFPSMTLTAAYLTAAGSLGTTVGSGGRLSAATINAVQLLMSAGNLTGTVRVYGLANS